MAPPQRSHPWAAVTERAQEITDRYQESRIGRTLARYSLAKGRLLAGGIAYSALFSIFAGLAIAYTAFVRVLGDHEQLRERVLTALDEALPGVIDDGSEGLVRPEELVLDAALTATSVVAGGVLLWTALSTMTAIKRSVQAMFGIVAPPVNVILGKVRDLGGFLLLALGILTTSALNLAAGALGEAVLGFLGVEGAVAGVLLRALGLAIAGVVDAAVLVLIVRVSAGVRPVRRDLLIGAAIWAVASGAMRLVGTNVLGSVSDDPLLASFAALATLLLWVNVLARIALYLLAFMANPPAPPKPDEAQEVHFDQRPNYVTLSEPATLNWSHQPLTGTIVPDPTLHPEHEPAPEPEPYWGGLVAKVMRWRAARLEGKVARLRERAGYGDEASRALRA